jgi:hypothetical protein
VHAGWLFGKFGPVEAVGKLMGSLAAMLDQDSTTLKTLFGPEGLSNLAGTNVMAKKTSRQIPRTVAGWFNEIRLAIADAREAKPFGLLVGEPITDANLFHLAPLVCLKFRGRKLVGHEASRITETALANSVVNSDPEGVDHGLKSKPLLAFAVCYVTAHLALDLVDEQEAEAILDYCEDHLEGAP